MPLRNSQQGLRLGRALRALGDGAVRRSLAWPLGQFREVFPRGAALNADLFVHMSLGLGVILLLVLQARLARARSAAAGDSPPAIRAVDRLRRHGRTSAALRAADRDADPRRRAAIRARPGAAGFRPVRRSVALGDGSRVLPRDPRAAPARRQCARRGRARPCRGGLVPPLGARRPHARAHAAGWAGARPTPRARPVATRGVSRRAAARAGR